MLRLILLLLIACNVCLAQVPELWFYDQRNLLPEENIDDLEKLWRRAAAAGYTKVLLADHKFGFVNRLGSNEAQYRKNVGRIRGIARDLGIEIIPAIFPIGYSNSFLVHDPNLAEGLPVRDALFVVKNGEARLVPDPAVKLNERPDWHDDAFVFEGGAATTRGHEGNARLVWKLGVSPYRCYHVSVKVKTNEYRGKLEIKPIVGRSRVLAFTNLQVKPTQDWTEHHIVFGSLDADTVSIYMGVWGDAAGEMSLRDWKIEEVGLLNVLRRDGAPCVVKGYTEGVDYEEIRDEKLGMVPWPGDYSVWHEPPVIRTKTIPEGTQLHVSWYFPMVIGNDQVCICPSEPKVKELLAEQARVMWGLFEPMSMMMSHDEVRVLNHDKSCLDRGMTPGAILAENVAYCQRLLPAVNVYVWNDMFDPNHNAVDEYYLVNGDLEGSWKGLEPRTTIVNWHFGNRDRSLPFFAKRGHKQIIAGYYDGPVDQVREWLVSARKVDGVVGVMYTTWERDYSQLERFAEIVRSAK